MNKLITSSIIINRGDNNGEVEIELVIQGFVHYHVEKDSRSDADGNRGFPEVFIDEVTDFEASDQDGNVFALEDKEKDRAIDKLVDHFLNSI